MAQVFENITNHPVAWGESDIDEMLAEYLLDDIADTADDTVVTLSFNNIDEVKRGSRVSPEHSEDGNMPHVADTAYLPTPARFGSSPSSSVPDPLSNNLSDSLIASEKRPTKRALETTSVNQGFLIDEKELADAVSKALEIPVRAVLPVTPVEKKTKPTKRRRVEDVSSMAVQSAIKSVPSTDDDTHLLPLSPEPIKASRRKDCPEESERRRERNRILARKSRQKKKNIFETLQKEVARLNRQNQIMKEMITTKMGVNDLDRILEQYAPDEESVEHTIEAASVSGSDSD